MVRIRLRRVGAKKQPHYRVVVADQRSPRDGRHIETIGYYNPRTEPETVVIEEGRALHWLSQGAQPSDVVRHMLEKQGTLARLARLKAGEPLEALIAEYEADAAAEPSVEPAVSEPVEEAAAAETETAVAEAGSDVPGTEPDVPGTETGVLGTETDVPRTDLSEPEEGDAEAETAVAEAAAAPAEEDAEAEGAGAKESSESDEPSAEES